MTGKAICLAIMVGLLVLTGVAFADVARIVGVSAANDDNRPARNATNGSGMSGDLHDNTHHNTWLTGVGTNGGGHSNPHPGTYNPGPGEWTWIKFEFDRIYSLRELRVWNYNEWTVRGLRRVVIEYTVDGVSWQRLGKFLFSRAPSDGSGKGMPSYRYNTTVDFGGAAAKAVVITTEEGAGVGNWGDGFPLFGLSEVRFITDPNPAAIEQPLESGKFGRAIRVQPEEPYFWAEARLLPEYVQLPITVECWVKLEARAEENHLIAAGLRDSHGHWSIFSEAGSGELACSLGGKTPSRVSSKRNIADGLWHHVSMVVEETRVRLGVDGILVADVGLRDAPSSSDDGGAIYFGAYPPDDSSLVGLLDEVRISRGVRDLTQIPTSRFPLDASTVGLWRFDRYRDHDNTVKFDDWSTENNPALIEPPPLFPLIGSPPAAELSLQLGRGVSLDRQYRQMPVEAIMTILSVDIFIIKEMGFDFVKLIVNPELHKSGAGLLTSNMAYLDTIVNRVVNAGLPAVVTIHPEHLFKEKILGSSGEFEDLLGFYEAFAAYMSARWSPDELAFQLMTEPYGNYDDWNVLQTRMWRAVRTGMPDHTLILSGDDGASISALTGLQPVDDENVLYCFEFYEPWIFSIQGARWTANYSGIARLYRYFFDVPYPSSPQSVAAVLPSILGGIPSQNRTEAQSALEAYGEERWNQDRLAANLQPVLDWRARHGGALKLFVGEFGVLPPDQGGVDPEDRYAFLRDVRELFERNDVDWAIWSFNETLTVLDPNVRVPNSKSPKLSWIDEKMQNALFETITETGGRVPGDLSGDDIVDISDSIAILFHLFLGKSVLPCEGNTTGTPGPGDLMTLDWDGNGRIEFTDPIAALKWLFLGVGPGHSLGSTCVSIGGCPPSCAEND